MKSITLIARHLIAAIGGMCAHHGVNVDASSTGSIIAALLFLGVSMLWSFAAKAEPSDDAKAVLQKAAGAFASQIVAALAGWLHVDAATAADPVALSVFVGNLTVAKVRGHVPAAKLGQWASLMVLGSLFSVLCCSCSTVSQDAFKKRLESALADIGKEASATALEGTLAYLRTELDTLLRAPVDEDVTQQLIDQNRIAALKAAIKLGEERLAKLRGGKSAIEVNPGSKFQVSGFKFNPSGRDAEAACAGQSRESGAHSVNHPRGLCLGNSAGCKLTPNTARHNAVEHPVLMLRADAAARSTSRNLQIPRLAPQVIAALRN